jgi:tetratricopeptide (TPR) repeat protein
MRRSVELADWLLEATPDDDARIMRRAKCGQDLGRCLLLADRYGEACPAYETAESFWRRARERAPDDEERTLRLANSLMNHAVALVEHDKAAAESMYLEALALQQANVARQPRNLIYRREVALATEALALLAWRRGDVPRGRTLGEEAEAMLAAMERENPRNEQCRWYASRCRLNLGSRLFRGGRPQDAAFRLRQGYEGMRRLSNDYPRNLQYMEAIVEAAAAVGSILETSGEAAAATRTYREGVEHYRKLRSASPERANTLRVAAIRIHLAFAAQLATEVRWEAWEILRQIPRIAFAK